MTGDLMRREALLVQANESARRKLLHSPPRRIAVLRALNLGDLLHSIPAFRSLRRQFPGSEITLIGLPWAESLVERYSHYIDGFAAFPGHSGVVEEDYDPERTGTFIAHQRTRQYDLAVQMHGSGYTTNAFVAELGARLTAGFYDIRNPILLDIHRLYPDWLSETDRHLQLVRELGCEESDAALEFPLYQEDRREAEDVLKFSPATPLIGIHAGARAPSRRWPLERFAELADRISALTGGTLILTGGPDEVDQVSEVASLMTQPALNIAGATSLGGLAAVIKRLDLFISNDTGPAHIARAVGTPSVTVFGPADPVRWAPGDQSIHRVVREAVHCSPCPHWHCPIDHRCLQWIDVTRVFDEATNLLNSRRRECIA